MLDIVSSFKSRSNNKGSFQFSHQEVTAWGILELCEASPESISNAMTGTKIDEFHYNTQSLLQGGTMFLIPYTRLLVF